MNDLVCDVNLSKGKNELFSSHLQQWNVLYQG